MRKSHLFTSESVSEGHPDKVSDQISDAILDAFLENDIKLGIADDSLVNTRLLSADGYSTFSSRDAFGNATSGINTQEYVVRANQAKIA